MPERLLCSTRITKPSDAWALGALMTIWARKDRLAWQAARIPGCIATSSCHGAYPRAASQFRAKLGWPEGQGPRHSLRCLYSNRKSHSHISNIHNLENNELLITRRKTKQGSPLSLVSWQCWRDIFSLRLTFFKTIGHLCFLSLESLK